MRFLAAFLFAWMLTAQDPPAPPPQPSPEEKESVDLSRAITDAGSSPVDFIRSLEAFLKKYPNAKQLRAIEKALAKSAMESNDRARIVLYGEKVLEAEPASEDLQLFDRLTRTLLDTDDPEPAKQALGYAKRYEAAVEAMGSKTPQGHMSEGQWSEEVNKGRSRALVLEARATGNIGNAEEALKVARRAWGTYPSPEDAREVARWLAKLDRNAEAIDFYADAFVLQDARSTDEDRARDRLHMGEIYTKINGSEKGLGDVILQAYDRTAALKRDRAASLKAKDPNAAAADVSDYTLPAVAGDRALALSSLKGKTVVLDFWATWCGPCRVQHPMIENVKKRYEKTGNVVFLSVDSDDDHSPVPAFLKEMHWEGASYYDAGLSRFLNISAIPTVIILDPAGRVSSRMAGFVPERFEELLAERIDETRKN